MPELIKLIQVLQKQIEEQKVDQKVKDSVKTIHEAFLAKDPTALNKLFNS